MKIAVDLDDVLANITHTLDNFHNKTYGTKAKYEDHIVFDLSQAWNCSYDEMRDRVMAFFESDYMDKIEPVKGSIEMIKKLSGKNELIIVTSRPKITEDKTRNWIDKYYPKRFSDIIFTGQFANTEVEKNKGDFCIEMGADLIIEDSLRFMLECAQKEIRVLLFDRPWNQSEKNLPKNVNRVFSWNEIGDILK